MLLMKADRFFLRYFEEGSRPSAGTRARWLQTKVVPSKKVGGQWFVDVHAWLADGNALVETVLAG